MPDTLEINVAPFGLADGKPNFPHPTQRKILDWFSRVKAGNSGVKGTPVLYIQGGWRSGKTSAALCGVRECMEEYPGIRVLIGRKDFNDLRLSTMESWREQRPKEFVRHEDKQEHREEWHNGSQIFFRELKDLEGLGGQEFGIILVSEPYELEREIYFRLKGRLSQKGMPNCLILEGNPPNEGHWLHKLVKGDDKTPRDEDVTFFQVSTDENKATLPPAYWHSMETAPASWQKKYRLGDWGFTPEGQPVYDIFKEFIHVRDVPILQGRPLIRSWDSGVRHPACLWAQTTQRGQLFVQYEWLGLETSLIEFAKGVILRTNEYYADHPVVLDYGDPAMYARSPQTGKSDATILQENHQIQFRGRQSTHQDRKSLIDGRLSLLVDSMPAVLIHPRCRILIDGLLGGYHYPKRDESKAFGKPHEIPFKDGFFDHLCLHGDSKVRTLRGWIPIRDLVGKTFTTYSYDGRRLVPSVASNVYKTKEQAEVWKLTHDGGELIATPDHLIMRRDGTYARLDQLLPGDSLMPFYDSKGVKGHTSINLNDGSSAYEHRYIYSWFRGHLKEGHHIHHIDANPTNNSPENLEQMTAKDHMSEVYARMRVHPKWVDARRAAAWTPELRKRISIWRKAYFAENRNPKLCLICKKGYLGLPHSKYCSKRCNWKSKNPEYRHLVTPRKLKLLPENHKVISVEPYGFADVYDMTVEGHHNYPANGIMVHNCNSFEYLIINCYGSSEGAARKVVMAKRARMAALQINGGGAYF